MMKWLNFEKVLKSCTTIDCLTQTEIVRKRQRLISASNYAFYSQLVLQKPLRSNKNFMARFGCTFRLHQNKQVLVNTPTKKFSK